jgi:putative MATE family efflux protein
MNYKTSYYIRTLNQVILENHVLLKRLLRDVKEAIAGTDQDFTTGSLGRAIFLLSVPMVLEMMMESIFAVVDIFFVSRLGAGAVATVGITESLMTIIYAIGAGLATATTAMVSRRIGEKHPEGASVVAFQSILAGIAVSLLIAIPGFIFAHRILVLMGAEHEIADSYSVFTRIMLGGNIVITLLFIINSIFRSAGDAAISMRVLFFANIINIILDPLLIFGLGPFPAMGIAGAAMATTTGRGLAVVYQFYLLFKGKGRVKLSLDHLRFDFPVMKNLIRLSMGGMGQSLIATSSWVLLVRILTVFGSAVVAGYTIAIRIVIFSLLPSFGISNAAATLVGQNLGAKQPGRAERSAWITGIINIILLGIIGLVFIVIPSYFIRIFISQEDVIFAGSGALRIMSYGFLAYGLGMVMVNALNGAGDTTTPTKINFFCYWLLEIPLAYVLAIPLNMHEDGVFYSILIAETVMTVSALIIFRRGKWKRQKV